jgi:hypothetical protein
LGLGFGSVSESIDCITQRTNQCASIGGIYLILTVWRYNIAGVIQNRYVQGSTLDTVCGSISEGIAVITQRTNT